MEQPSIGELFIFTTLFGRVSHVNSLDLLLYLEEFHIILPTIKKINMDGVCVYVHILTV